MEKAEIVFTYAGNNFGAYLPELDGCVATGQTAGEVKENILGAVKAHIAASLADDDPLPDKFKGEFEFVFRYDAQSLLNYYKGIFTKASLSRITGINQQQLQHYADGVKKPRPAQIEKIEKGLHNLANDLLAVQL